MLSIWEVMLALAACPRWTIRMTLATPMMTPRAVSVERTLLRAMALRAI